MQLKQILLKATKGRTNCSRKGCPIYDINVDIYDLNKMYKHLTGENISYVNHFSFCSECFLSLCYEYNKKRTKEMFDKYVFYEGSNFFEDSANKMPCKLLGEMAKFMLNNKKYIDIE
jgi:hypothetical protein